MPTTLERQITVERDGLGREPTRPEAVALRSREVIGSLLYKTSGFVGRARAWGNELLAQSIASVGGEPLPNLPRSQPEVTEPGPDS